jgi:hypothetical protein
MSNHRERTYPPLSVQGESQRQQGRPHKGAQDISGPGGADAAR